MNHCFKSKFPRGGGGGGVVLGTVYCDYFAHVK